MSLLCCGSTLCQMSWPDIWSKMLVDLKSPFCSRSTLTQVKLILGRGFVSQQSDIKNTVSHHPSCLTPIIVQARELALKANAQLAFPLTSDPSLRVFTSNYKYPFLHLRPRPLIPQ
jgi:hypothetical protein